MMHTRVYRNVGGDGTVRKSASSGDAGSRAGADLRRDQALGGRRPDARQAPTR